VQNTKRVTKKIMKSTRLENKHFAIFNEAFMKCFHFLLLMLVTDIIMLFNTYSLWIILIACLFKE